MKTVKGGQEWDFSHIEETFEQIERIARDKFKLKTYPNQIEIISSEQMLDAYCSVGMPLYYSHWSYGKNFVDQSNSYKRGFMGLAYEIVINSSPCISYLMEENTMLMQTLVMAHACFGHNHFFKNNYLFKQWTDAESIIDYLVFAKKYIAECEELYGEDEVERVIDACHAIQQYGVDKYKRPSTPSAAEEKARREERDAYIQSQLNDLWSTVPKTDKVEKDKKVDCFPCEPQENIMYFIEKNAPNLPQWKREIIRIVRKMSQYFYPQPQTKMMNEGCATYFHYKIIHAMYDEGLLDDGAMLEFYQSHTGVVRQQKHAPFNPYALGFAMFNDIERVATEPTEEDIEWFSGQDWVGSGDWLGTIHWAIENFKDESFIQQFLTPKVMRDFKMFDLLDDDREETFIISAIQDDYGYKRIRDKLALQHNYGYHVPDIQVTEVDRWGDRSMTLTHYMTNCRPLEKEDTVRALNCIAYLWGYDVKLESVDEEGRHKATYDIKDDETILDIFLDDD